MSAGRLNRINKLLEDRDMVLRSVGQLPIWVGIHERIRDEFEGFAKDTGEDPKTMSELAHLLHTEHTSTEFVISKISEIAVEKGFA